MQNVILSTTKLCKSFSSGGLQQHILKNMDLIIYQGDFTVIMGPSGAGKSTLLYALSGMDKLTFGSIHFDGHEIGELSDDKLAVFRRDHCGFVFQQIHLMDNMSVMDNILVCGLLVNKNRREISKRARQLLTRLNLDETTWGKFPAQLSGGEAQRVGIARALINQPQIVFADEPTGALNSANGQAVLNALSAINSQGQSVIMVTHDMKSALRGNRILYLQDGIMKGEYKLGNYIGGDRKRHERLSEFLTEMGW